MRRKGLKQGLFCYLKLYSLTSFAKIPTIPVEVFRRKIRKFLKIEKHSPEGRLLMKKTVLILSSAILLLLSACAKKEAPLPAPCAEEGSMFGVDKNINVSTIDSFLFREDAVYRDMRMLFDPADYGAIGGEADLTHTIEGFKIVPFPYLATLQSLPVGGAYDGDCLYTVEWNEDGTVKSAVPNYRESEMILAELFPKDKAVFLMCGGGGYAGMMQKLLIYLGWDEGKVYNVGANWEYKGTHGVELVVYPEKAGDPNIYATWRADYAYFDFSKMEPLP